MDATTKKSDVRGAVGALLVAAALVLLAVAAMRLGKAMSAKGASERQDATVSAVLSFKDDAAGGKSLIPMRVTRVTFDVEGAEGERVAGHADARLLFPTKGPAVGERVSVYRQGDSREYFLDRWPWNYGAVAEAGVPGIILGIIGAVLLIPVVRRRKSAPVPTV
jgi:hypothetical protein